MFVLVCWACPYRARSDVIHCHWLPLTCTYHKHTHAGLTHTRTGCYLHVMQRHTGLLPARTSDTQTRLLPGGTTHGAVICTYLRHTQNCYPACIAETNGAATSTHFRKTHNCYLEAPQTHKAVTCMHYRQARTHGLLPVRTTETHGAATRTHFRYTQSCYLHVLHTDESATCLHRRPTRRVHTSFEKSLNSMLAWKNVILHGKVFENH